MGLVSFAPFAESLFTQVEREGLASLASSRVCLNTDSPVVFVPLPCCSALLRPAAISLFGMLKVNGVFLKIIKSREKLLLTMLNLMF